MDSFQWKFIIYSADGVSAAVNVEQNLQHICAKYLKEPCEIEVINIKNASQPIPDDILAIPTIIRISPLPERRVIGDLSSIKDAVSGLGLFDVKPFLKPDF